ncbi:MAG TPA: hypothetical protein VMM36_00205 [Opitutaceae bacterium]|nr:hypothetical protein [Opitutaceae bacterium]
MSTLEAIVEDLRTLPPAKLEEVAGYVHRLREATSADQLAILRETSGVWSGPDGEAIEKAIEEGCERIDPRDW